MIGSIAVHNDTRRLRRMLDKGRARILFATISHRAGRWWIALNVEAADFHPALRHATRADDDLGGWVGVDLGLSAFAVAATADGREVIRITDGHRACSVSMRQQRKLSKSCPARRKDHAIATEQLYGWPGTTHMFRIFANISCIRYPMRWSIPTTVSSLRISTYSGCSATTASLAL